MKNHRPRLSSRKKRLVKGKKELNTWNKIQNHNEENQTRNGDRFETERFGRAGGCQGEG